MYKGKKKKLNVTREPRFNLKRFGPQILLISRNVRREYLSARKLIRTACYILFPTGGHADRNGEPLRNRGNVIRNAKQISVLFLYLPRVL